jgi:hypothetical protein
MTAYSTAVGPSSETRNRLTLLTRQFMAFHPRNSRIADSSAEIFDRSFSRKENFRLKDQCVRFVQILTALARAGDYEPPSLVLTLVNVVEAFVPTA